MIKVLVVDDSAVARELIVHVLEQDPEISVAGCAKDGAEALAFFEHTRPDVVTMDVKMPGMDGFETTRRIMSRHPVPVVIVTSILDPKADAAIFRTLEAGALMILQKPPAVGHPDYGWAAAELLQTVRLMSEVKVVRRFGRGGGGQKSASEKEPLSSAAKIVAIGASTGGPVVVHDILAPLPADYPLPVLVVQHMADGFIGGFAEWLDGSCRMRVKIGEHGERISAGVVYVAPGGTEMGVDGSKRIELREGEAGQALCPSVSYLFRSVARRFGKEAVGILLSGMGSDGAQGLKEMREAGGVTVAQDEASSVIFGMPAAAIKLRAAQHVLSPSRIVALLQTMAKRS